MSVLSVNQHDGETASKEADDGLGVAEANGWRRAPGGWVETDERARPCVFHGDRPLAVGERLFCARCQWRMMNEDGGQP